MAMNIRGFLKNNLKFLTSNILKPVTNNAKRQLYSPAALSMESYTEARSHILNQFASVSDNFRSKMNEFISDDSKSIIFTEDLKAMLHIVENNQEDIDLLMKMMKKFHAQNRELRFGNYVFGPVVMRAFYYLDLPNEALNAFKDPELNGFFDQLTSYQILLTLLFKHQRYQDIIDVYELIKEKYTGGIMYPQNTVILVLGSCYKENTPESFQYALNVWKELQERNSQPNRRSICLLAALALKQGKPEFALELITSCVHIRHIEVRCIKIKAYAGLKRFGDIENYMRRMMQLGKFQENSVKVTFFKDTIEDLEIKLKEAGIEKYPGLVKLLEEIKNHNLIQEVTLEESLCREVGKYRRREDEVTGGNRFSNYQDNRRQFASMK